MGEPTKNELDRLLADGELSGPEADAIFDRVYATVAREQPARGYMRPLLMVAGSLAAAALTLVLVRSTAAPSAGFTARGGATEGAGAAVLEVQCEGAALSACPLSSKLVFLASGTEASGYLSAYAEPLDAGAERVWYFSREASSPELTPAGEGTHVFERAIKLHGSHRPGRYRVRAFLAEQPLARAQMLGGADREAIRAAVTTDVTVTAGD